MSIPLVQNNEKDSINTSIIAIKRNIERINMLLGLSNSEEIDTSEFVKKSDIVDEVTVGNMQSVTSNAVYQSFKGMSVVECGKITDREEYDDSWYIKYDSGIIEEWWVQSSIIPSLSGSPIAGASFEVTFPIPLKSGTTALQFDVHNQSVYGTSGTVWFGTSNGASDSNKKQSVNCFSSYPYSSSSMRGNVKFHVVGFWK